jgi:hypothetical protein
VTDLAARQALLAAFIDDRKLEAWLRAHPEQAAERYAVSAEFVGWLAEMAPARLRQFRRSRAHKRLMRERG